MSRSYRKTPCMGNSCAVSEKDWKRQINRAMRRKTRAILQSSKMDMQYDVNGEMDLIFPIQEEIGDVWCSPKDGMGWFGDLLNRDNNMGDHTYWMRSRGEDYYRKLYEKYMRK